MINQNISPASYREVRPWHQTAVANLIAGVTYLLTFSHIYRTYISPTWEYTGLYYRQLGFWELSFQIAVVAVASAFLPGRIDKPSALIVWLLYAFVFIPTVAITFMIGFHPSSFYVTSLIALALALILCSIVSKRSEKPVQDTAPPSEIFVQIMLAGFVLSALALLVVYREILSFAAIDDVYTQRFAASDMDSGAITAYLRTYFTYVFSPALIAIGMVMPRRRWMILLGAGGYLLSYMIDASKIALVIPLAIIVLGIMRSYRLDSTAYFTGGLGILAAFTSLFTNASAFVRFLVDLVLLRSIAIPGQTFSQYYDLFSQHGYTFWSNTRIINLVVPPPAAFRSDPLWPTLGSIVGTEFYGPNSRMNANANLFAGEGVAAAGPIGVLVIALLLAWWLHYLDRASREWSATFSLTVMVPVGLGLTNVHLTTLLLSFGGFFWLIAFRLGSDKR